MNGDVIPWDHPDDPGAAGAEPELPVSYEAEQALLGALLARNTLYDAISDRLLAEHFADPVNQLVYETAVGLLDRGKVASPVTLYQTFQREERDEVTNGYLAELVEWGPNHPDQMRDYAETIIFYWEERQLLRLAEDIRSGEIREASAAESWLLQIGETLEQGEGAQDLAGAGYAAVQSLEADMRAKAAGEPIGLPTGLAALDKILLLKEGNLLVLGGRPSMGKTALAATIAANVARAYWQAERRSSVYFWSGEMSKEQISNRMLARYADVALDDIERRQLVDEHLQAVFDAQRLMADYPLHLDDDANITVPMLRARARRHKRRFGLGLVVVDYLQLLAPAMKRRSDGRVQDISEISRGLKALAMELKCPVLALSQLSRGVEGRDDKRPTLSDLRESGSIEQDADSVGFVYREEYYLARDKPKRRGSETQAAHEERLADHEAVMAQVAGICEAIIAKQRQGPTGQARLYFNAAQTYFTDLATEPAPEQQGGRLPF